MRVAKKKKNPGGRRNKYFSHVEPRFAEAELWLRDGLSEAQIYKNLGVGKTSWERYKKDYPELAELLKKGRETQVEEVENSLFKLATGFYYYVDEAVKVKLGNGVEEVKVVRLQKFKSPETGAVAFFLKNKAKDRYSDNPQMVDIKREELDLRREQAQFSNW